MMATVEFMAGEGVLTAALAGEIDHHTAARLRQQIDEEIDRRMPGMLVLDFGGVGFMDSSGVGLILGRQRRAKALGGSIRVQHAPQQLRRVLALARIPCADPGGGPEQPEQPAQNDKGGIQA